MTTPYKERFCVRYFI